MQRNTPVGLGLDMGALGPVIAAVNDDTGRRERARQSPPPSNLHPDYSAADMSRSSSFSVSDMSDLSLLSASSPSSRGSGYTSPWMPSGGFSPDTSSFAHFSPSHPQVVAKHKQIRQKKQRRLLNKLAIYLPRPLKPLASSYSRLVGTMAAGGLVLFLCVSALSSTPHGEMPGKTAYLPDGAKVHDLYRRATGREPPAFIASLIPGSSAPESGPKQEAKGLEMADDQETQTSQSEEMDKLRADFAKVQADLAEMQKQKMQTESSDGCDAKGCNVCGSRGCDPEGYLKGSEALLSKEPRAHFRDNLRKDLKYLTFGMANGFTNQFLAVANGIYLSKLSDRVPIVPPFAASPHMDRHRAGYLSYGKIFDMQKMETLLRSPVVDWESVKQSGELNGALGKPQNPEMLDEKVRQKKLSQVGKNKEKIGCWSLWAAQMPKPGRPAGSAVQNHLGLDIEYWQAPLTYSHPPEDRHIRFWDLVLLDQNIDDAKTNQLAEVAKVKREAMSKNGETIPNKDLSLPPDDQLLCFDTLYYTAATGPHEWWQPHAPVWKSVGRYAHWHPDVSEEADRYIRSTLKVEEGSRTPEFVSVHIRRGDFTKWCKAGTPANECFPSLEVYKAGIKRVKDQLLDTKGLYARHVIVTSDDTSPMFQESVKKVGWYMIDHKAMDTAKKHGLWWEIVLDAAIQSKGSAFVGTDKSMMSLVAGKRVEDWNKGPWELVKWVPGSK